MSTDARALPTWKLARQIKVAMLLEDISGRQLAQKLGVSQTWISTRLTGATPIDVNDLVRMAEAIGVSPVNLLAAAVNDQTTPSNGRSRHTSPERRRGPRSRVITRPNGRPRNDSTRPVSPVPPTQRRANPIRTADRPIATRFPRDHDQ